MSTLRTAAGLLRPALLVVLLCLMACPLPVLAASPPPDAPSRQGSQTGLPLPRFVRIKGKVANLRRGPGVRYPIMWVYHRRHLPVLILREFGNWRQLRLPDGTLGWMHRALLTGGRSFVVRAARATLRQSAHARSAPVAHLRRGVIGVLRHCHLAWCKVTSHGYSGFVRRSEIWGSDGDARGVGTS